MFQNKEETPENMVTNIGKKLSEISFAGIAMQVGRLETLGTSLNKTLSGTKERIVEIKEALGDTIPDFVGIGGTASDAERVLGQLALATRRSMIANSKLATDMFASFKILGRDVQVTAEDFLDVGYNLSKIPGEIEKSIEYVRSVGGNAREVTNQVLNNMDKINRYQFEGGIIGLTKMAAQASMLRFDMNETFKLADKALNPEQAIELSSAFQRLGISAGNLVDPFQLMYQSLTDPQGLQDSLIRVAEQFTEFDEKAGKFKIPPASMLMLKQIGEQAGISAEELMKAGLASSELNRRLSQLSPTIKFEKEEDKQFLANIATMGEGGEYEVRISDNVVKKLADITQPEFDELIKEQRKQPETLQDIAYQQLQLTEKLYAAFNRLADNITLGVASSRNVSREIAGAENVIEATLGSITQNINLIQSENIRNLTDKTINKLKDLILNPPKTVEDFTKLKNEAINEFRGIKDTIKQDLAEVKTKASENLQGGSVTEEAVNGLFSQIDKLIGELDFSFIKDNFVNTIVDGIEAIPSPTEIQENIEQKLKVEFDDLDMNLNLSLPDAFKNLDLSNVKQIIDGIFETDLKKKIIEMIENMYPSLKQSRQSPP